MAEQHELGEEKIMKKALAAAKEIETGNVLLMKSKQWNGPITSMNDFTNLVATFF